jgi:hypothetical protein
MLVDSLARGGAHRACGWRASSRSGEAQELRTIGGTPALEEISGMDVVGADERMNAHGRRASAANIVVTKRPGGRSSRSSERGRIARFYPLVPTVRDNALGIALFRYEAVFFWGFNADWGCHSPTGTTLVSPSPEFEVLRKL